MAPLVVRLAGGKVRAAPMSDPQPWHFTTLLDLVDHWQTLIAGGLAVLAAWENNPGDDRIGRPRS